MMEPMCRLLGIRTMRTWSLSILLQVLMQICMASLSLLTTQGILAEASTVLVMQLGYICSMSISLKILLVMAEARPQPRAFPWDSLLRFRKQVRCTFRPPEA